MKDILLRMISDEWDRGRAASLMQSYMDVEDLEGRVLNAIKEYGCDLTVLGNYGNSAPGVEPVTSGHWDDIAYDSLSDTTTFTDFSATFPPQAVNWWLQPDAARSTYLEILSISGSTVTVAGDATGLAHGLIPQPGPPPLPDIIGTFYTIVWPAGVDPASGTLAHNDPCEPIGRLLFAGYYYMPPVAGTMIQPPGGGTGTHGAQPGGNHHGDYYCWNRVYAQKNGVWTTPDPAASPASDETFKMPESLSGQFPWSNLRNYGANTPIGVRDPAGLLTATETSSAGQDPWKAEGYHKRFKFKDTPNTILIQHVIRTHMFGCKGEKYWRKIVIYEYAEWFLTDARGDTVEDTHSLYTSYNDVQNLINATCPQCAPCTEPHYTGSNKFEIQTGTLSPGAQVPGANFGYLSSWIDQVGTKHDSTRIVKTRCPNDTKWLTTEVTFPVLDSGSPTNGLGTGTFTKGKTFSVADEFIDVQYGPPPAGSRTRYDVKSGSYSEHGYK
ncbi:MAG: hypothetical protein H6841_06160 [Planctomycetes bacterium]|nr:hypothetical protein [Planctomycetota bacterium]